MIIGVLTVSLSIPEARSLKDKRAILRSLKDRIMHRINVSAAEVGKQDLWQAAELAFVTVAAEKMTVDKRLSEISSLIRSNPRYIVIDLHTEIL